MVPEADAELARKIAQGTHDSRLAEAEFCRRFAPRIRLYGLRHLRSEDGARELVQTVLLAVLEALRSGRVEEPEHVDRFVLGTSRNVARRQRQGEARAQVTDPAELDVGSYLPEPEAFATEAIFRCLGGLDLRGRNVVYATFFKGRSTSEIASELSASEGNVRVLRHRAILQLRRCLDAGKEHEA